MTAREFGRWGDATEIYDVEIAAGDRSVRVITWGAVVRDLRLAGHSPPLVLGLNGLEEAQRPFGPRAAQSVRISTTSTWAMSSPRASEWRKLSPA